MSKYEVVKQVVMPQIKLVKDTEYLFRIEGAMHKGKKRAGDDKEAPTLMDVTDLNSGECGQVIVNAALAINLNDAYPKDGYVGKNFAITIHTKTNDKQKANPVSIAEIKMKKSA